MPEYTKKGKITKREHPIIICSKTNLILDFDRTDLVSTFPTKRTPIINVQFTPVNHCLVAGTYQAPESR